MIRVPSNKVAVIPIFDSPTLDIAASFNPAERRLLAELGVTELKKDLKMVIPDQAKERCDQGIVKYIGKDVTTLAPGDYVIFSGYTGTLLSIEGEGQLILMPEEFITAVIEEDVPSEVPGLFFQDRDGNYFPANHEHACVLISRAYKGIPVKTPRPDPKDYDKLRGG